MNVYDIENNIHMAGRPATRFSLPDNHFYVAVSVIFSLHIHYVSITVCVSVIAMTDCLNLHSRQFNAAPTDGREAVVVVVVNHCFTSLFGGIRVGHWQSARGLWPDTRRLQLPLDDCCRLVLPYNAVHSIQQTKQIPNDPPRMGAKSTTTSNHPSTPGEKQVPSKSLRLWRKPLVL